MKEIVEQHILTYDRLASEYDQRADTLRPVTEHAVQAFHEYLPSGSVLDVGCGAGTLVQTLRENGYEASGIDISTGMVDVAIKRVGEDHIFRGDFSDYPFPEKFDGIFAFAFIHLYPKTMAAEILKRMNSYLRPGGFLYIGTTESSVSFEGFEQKIDYSGEESRFRKHWTREEFTDALTETGFEIVRSIDIQDPFGKKWMDFIARAN